MSGKLWNSLCLACFHQRDGLICTETLSIRGSCGSTSQCWLMNGGCGSLWSRAHSVAMVGEGPWAGDGLLTAIACCFFSSKWIISLLCFLFVGMMETFWLSFSFFLFKKIWGMNWKWKGCEMLVSFCWGESEGCVFSVGTVVAKNSQQWVKK